MEPIPQYQSRPPPWVPQATRDGDLGYHGFHPPRPRQGEDILDATTIKSGYLESPFVTVIPLCHPVSALSF
jgi:mediator of RNA polymerase II transcription subunit 12